MYDEPSCGANVARFAFCTMTARRFYTDWERMARFAVGALRIEAGKNPTTGSCRTGSVEDLVTSAGSRTVEDAAAKEVEVGPAEAHALEKLGSGHVPLDLA
jgi:hypothetical protein